MSTEDSVHVASAMHLFGVSFVIYTMKTMEMPRAEQAHTGFDIVELWRRFDGRLRSFILQRINSRDVAEDIVQDIYLKIHTSIGSLRNPERIESWLFQIARNSIADYYRKRRPQIGLNEEIADKEEDREEAEFESELRLMTRRMIDRLPSIYREALSAIELRGMSQSDAARETGVSLPGMKSRVQRARRMLKAMLLDCCHFELDRRGRIIDYAPHCTRCCAAAS